jgi:hypothetical protein
MTSDKAPMFFQPATGTVAQQYLHRARMFREAAVNLPAYSNGRQFLPKYALLTHAIELSLKAFALHSVSMGKPSGVRPSNHDLRGWYRLALQYGLQDDPTISDNINRLSELHFTHYTRYPQEPTAKVLNVPELSDIADSTIDHLILAFTQSINPRS